MSAKLSLHRYLKPVRLHARGALVLGTRLIKAAPKRPSKAVRACLAELSSARESIKASHDALGAAPRLNMRPIDRSFDSGWAALRDRVTPWTGNGHPDAEAMREAAARVMAAYFARGLSFTQLSYEKEWIESARRIDQWNGQDALREELCLVAGESFVDNVELQHARLTAALGLDGKRRSDEATTKEASSREALTEAVEAFSDALAEYIRVYGGELDTKDEASVTAFVEAMAPLEAYRAAQVRTPVPEEEDVEDGDADSDAPSPPPPVTPPVGRDEADDERDVDAPLSPVAPAPDEIPIGHRGRKPLRD